MSAVRRIKSILIIILITSLFSACGGGSDSSGSAVLSDADERPSNEALIAQAAIERQVNGRRDLANREIDSFTDLELFIPEEIRGVEFENRLSLILIELRAETAQDIVDIVDGRNLTLISGILYDYLFNQHKDDLNNAAQAVISSLTISSQSRSVTAQRTLSVILQDYCNLTATLETLRILRPSDLSPEERALFVCVPS